MTGPRCTRLTMAGTVCKRHRIIGAGSGGAPESCDGHLTSAERSALGRDKPRTPRPSEEDVERAWLLALDIPPACWFWPVPDDLNRAAPELALTVWQAGRCAICGGRYPLVKDHSHETGMGRGLLCRDCNTREGMPTYRYLDATVFAYYRQRPPVDIIGVSFRYVDPLYGPDPGFGPPPDPADRYRDNAMRGVL